MKIFRYFIAVLFIIIGILLVLANVGAVQFNLGNTWKLIYSIFFVVIGLKWLVDFLMKKGGSWVFGSFFLIFGSLLLLDWFHIIYFTFWDVFKLWPLLIVYIGVMLISGKSHIVIEHKGKRSGKTKEKKYGNSVFTVGSHEYNKENWKVQPMSLRTLAGDFYFDFTKAFIPEKNIPITVNSFAGDVNIIMPENVAFRVEASVNAGDIEVLGQTADGINRTLIYETDDYDDVERKIDFKIHLKAGSIRVDQV
ncbi:cell wall-active antibiotics response protein LiaF [Oceanobacillus halophilus]|uniref:Cell wall-active antibiotics response LiaF-like C-terminal domain-containing protein n=1 Tax=Oceanobacillus halophilus TaxID=930130 RepID=A0A494ZX61_9BACI|nr:cell wall-active antibiotics response protein LiaF [Oceanobacillus halophilus]RKQ31286.1 hypothetical protein D8M06_14535 [Oceanobacillus halophilus]